MMICVSFSSCAFLLAAFDLEFLAPKEKRKEAAVLGQTQKTALLKEMANKSRGGDSQDRLKAGQKTKHEGANHDQKIAKHARTPSEIKTDIGRTSNFSEVTQLLSDGSWDSNPGIYCYELASWNCFCCTPKVLVCCVSAFICFSPFRQGQAAPSPHNTIEPPQHETRAMGVEMGTTGPPNLPSLSGSGTCEEGGSCPFSEAALPYNTEVGMKGADPGFNDTDSYFS
ncbi:uncharacterized protein LOC125101136 [Lutra lutra]|uniref:uncharacterized protein LOC125101136 n=1 Tax=Lutra lutra TaxID=9657 RepID=UPI001FD381A7|nr:uncharacterized protein LOC125101136 [Lutra lutra]